MDYFRNCGIVVERHEGNRTPAGYEETGTKTVLECRADFQESGRSLERLQQLHETGDGLLFPEEDCTDVQPGDSVELDMDDGRRLEGSVEKARSLDRSLLVVL